MASSPVSVLGPPASRPTPSGPGPGRRRGQGLGSAGRPPWSRGPAAAPCGPGPGPGPNQSRQHAALHDEIFQNFLLRILPSAQRRRGVLAPKARPLAVYDPRYHMYSGHIYSRNSLKLFI